VKNTSLPGDVGFCEVLKSTAISLNSTYGRLSPNPLRKEQQNINSYYIRLELNELRLVKDVSNFNGAHEANNVRIANGVEAYYCVSIRE
jgi:hypothetical protein